MRLKQFKGLVESVVDRSSVRVERELENLNLVHEEPVVPGAMGLPDLESLDRVALRRELLAVRQSLEKARAKIAELQSQAPAENSTQGISGFANTDFQISPEPVANPDEAPNGLSHGDSPITGELQGWHWLTGTRPSDPEFGFQLALSDTAQEIMFRVKRHAIWSDWRSVAGKSQARPKR